MVTLVPWVIDHHEVVSDDVVRATFLIDRCEKGKSFQKVAKNNDFLDQFSRFYPYFTHTGITR